LAPRRRLQGLEKSIRVNASKDYLTEYLSHAPVALALIRAIECRKLAALPIERPLLDLGCGDGLFGKLFFENKPEVGLDFSMHELQAAARRQAYRSLSCGDMTKMPFADDAFATVFSNGVLEHVHHLDAALHEIARVLRPGGRLIFTVPTTEDDLHLIGANLLRGVGLTSLADGYIQTYHNAFGHINLFHPDDWRRRLAMHGLQVIDGQSYGSPAFFRLHNLTLPASLPNAICKRLTGFWSVLPGVRRATVAPLWAALTRGIYQEESAVGCSWLAVAVKPAA
jgi:SAM-dependent methyltransferase